METVADDLCNFEAGCPKAGGPQLTVTLHAESISHVRGHDSGSALSLSFGSCPAWHHGPLCVLGSAEELRFLLTEALTALDSVCEVTQ